MSLGGNSPVLPGAEALSYLLSVFISDYGLQITD